MQLDRAGFLSDAGLVWGNDNSQEKSWQSMVWAKKGCLIFGNGKKPAHKDAE
jgi:hypothetical protein